MLRRVPNRYSRDNSLIVIAGNLSRLIKLHEYTNKKSEKPGF